MRGQDPYHRDSTVGERERGHYRTQQQQQPMSFQQQLRQMTAEEKAEILIRDAERVKAQILPARGKDMVINSQNMQVDHTFSAIVDESFIVVGSHLDQTMIDKIQRGEYVDFGCLIPRDRVLIEEDQRLEMVIRDGKTYYVPVSETSSI